ncbi:hypothetical protein [Chromobacterium haemolyticum]|uniref:hypothetical protein n=1 Tax=Chromobacterium haemolyticum TaxID=394935 RepID=UPI0009DA4621|nr:hypothetical protein [Chromobacterium haemolyticum]OQS41145.1 hypothetical protein B0T39_09300 [Chromobacterium haemolyticum]
MKRSHLDRATVREIFRVLRGSFGSVFLEKFRTGKLVEGGPNDGHDVGVLEAMDVWAQKLRNLSPADVKHGLDTTFKHPPSCDEFLTACCARDIRPPAPEYNPNQLTGPRMTREEAEVQIAQVKRAARSMRFPSDNVRKLEWAYAIADETARGVYKGGMHGKRMAAEAIQDSRKPVPESLVPFLTKTNPMEDAA